jgi:acyl carrier protein
VSSAVQSNAEIFSTICDLTKPFNLKGITLTRTTTFSMDLDLDSLTVMDLVANIEDEYDILIPLNLLPDLETMGHVADAVEKIIQTK